MTEKEIIHRKIYEYLKTLSKDEIRLALVDIANKGPITQQELENMNYEKLEITEKFYHLHWSRMIDLGFLDENDGAESITVVNPMRFSKRDDLGYEVAKLKKNIRLERLGRKPARDDTSSLSSNAEEPSKRAYAPAVFLWAT